MDLDVGGLDMPDYPIQSNPIQSIRSPRRLSICMAETVRFKANRAATRAYLVDYKQPSVTWLMRADPNLAQAPDMGDPYCKCMAIMPEPILGTELLQYAPTCSHVLSVIALYMTPALHFCLMTSFRKLLPQKSAHVQQIFLGPHDEAIASAR